MTVYEFKGWDWTELAEAFSIEAPNKIKEDKDNPFAEEEYLAEEIKKILKGAMTPIGNCAALEEDKIYSEEVAGVVRAYLRAMRGKETEEPFCEEQKLAAAIADMEDWGTLKYTCVLLEHLWT